MAPAPRAFRRGDMVQGIDFETVRRLRQIARGMKRGGAESFAFVYPLDQPAALTRESGFRGLRDRIAQQDGQMQFHFSPSFTWPSSFTCDVSLPVARSKTSTS